jgi:hypothetical protein
MRSVREGEIGAFIAGVADHSWAAAVDIGLLVQQVPCCVIVPNQDDIGAAEIEADEWSILVDPFAERVPGTVSGRLVKVSNQRETRGSRREPGTLASLIECIEEDDDRTGKENRRRRHLSKLPKPYSESCGKNKRDDAAEIREDPFSAP